MRLAVAASIAALLMPGTAAAQQNLRLACRVGTLCPGVEPGSGEFMQCLRENRSRLSVGCRLAIADRVLNRQGGGGGRGERDGGGLDGDRDGTGGRGQGLGPGGRDDAPDQGPDGPGPRGGYREGGGPDGPDGPLGYRNGPDGGPDRGGRYDGRADQNGSDEPGPR